MEIAAHYGDRSFPSLKITYVRNLAYIVKWGKIYVILENF